VQKRDTVSSATKTDPHTLFFNTLQDALRSNINLLLLTGLPGTDLSIPTTDIARSMSRGTYHIRTSLLMDDEMVLWDDPSRLQADLRPRGDMNGITIFEDIDGLSDAGLKALENEVSILSRTQPAAQIVLISNFRKKLVERLRIVAPGLLNRAFSLHLDTPIHPSIQEFIKNSPPVGILDFTDVRPPSMASWDKAGKITQKAQAGIDALREATHIVSDPGGLRNYALAPLRIQSGEPSHLIVFMESMPKLSHRVTGFMRDRSAEGDFGLMPKAWQDIARLVKLYDEACESGTKARQDQHAYLVRHYAKGHLRKNAADLLHHLGL
jgi:hypothetical protein